MSSIHNILREILPTVIRPSRYTGTELNVVQKDHATVDVKVALAFPDTYELGMSYLGFAILYHLLNRREDVLAERVYAPWVDMEERMRQRGVPLFALESKKPLRDFDVVAFTLPHELCYTNILNMLELAAIPLKSEERNGDHPLIIGGGMGAFNPEPLAEFVDAFVVGDGEEVVLEIVDTVKTHRGSPRQQMLQALSELKGVYVPSFYAADYDHGAFEGLVPVDPSLPSTIESRTVKTLAVDNYPPKPLVPFTEIEHDRLTIEIMRGCSRGCRFCNASVLYHPLRQRPVEEILSQAESGIASTGYDEISLLSLSATDYSALEELIEALNRRLAQRRVAIALPSLRPETFSKGLAKAVQTVRKSGLTFAPEAGTDRLRRVIKKSISDEDLLRAIEIAYEGGWKVIKLYFMIGLPTEQQKDIEAIAHLVREAVQLGKGYGGDKRVNVAISPFSPKAHTPFQWAAQEQMESLREKSTYLRERLRHRRIRLKWRPPEVSFIESIFARGDRRLSEVLSTAKQMGCRFDGWSDLFSYTLWQRAFEISKTDPHPYTCRRSLDEPLPWEHIVVGISKGALAREWLRSQERKEEAASISHPVEREQTDVFTKRDERGYGRSRRRRAKTPLQVAKARVRMRYAKGNEVRYLSHLDVVRVFERALRRAEVPISYSQGFHPHPKIAFGPPLALGMTSRAEYVDMQFEQPYSQDTVAALDRALPRGFAILDAKPTFGKTPSLSSIITQAEYRVFFDRKFSLEQIEEAVAKLLERSAVWVRREIKKVVKEVDIRPHILDARVEDDPEGVSLRLRLGTTETGHVKSSEVVSQMLSLPQDEVAVFLTERTEQFVERGGHLMTPMESV